MTRKRKPNPENLVLHEVYRPSYVDLSVKLWFKVKLEVLKTASKT